MAALLATVVNNIYMFFGSVFWGGLATILGRRRKRTKATWNCAYQWSRGVLATAGVHLRISFEADLDPEEHYVFLSNHQSLMDIPVLLRTLPRPASFLAKASLFRIPFFGGGIRAVGMIPVDRENRSSARASFAAAIESLEGGQSVLVFPEETRSMDGRLLPFQRGAFLIALKAGAPIVPIGVDGTRCIRPKGGIWVRPGTVRVRYGSPIATRGRSVQERRGLLDEVRREVSRLAGLGQPEPEGAANAPDAAVESPRVGTACDEAETR